MRSCTHIYIPHILTNVHRHAHTYAQCPHACHVLSLTHRWFHEKNRGRDKENKPRKSNLKILGFKNLLNKHKLYLLAPVVSPSIWSADEEESFSSLKFNYPKWFIFPGERWTWHQVKISSSMSGKVHKQRPDLERMVEREQVILALPT
jgi:hypothetical protein